MTLTKRRWIKASQATPGRNYLSEMGVPVHVKKVEPKGTTVLLQFSEKPLLLPPDHPLYAFNKKRINFDARMAAKYYRQKHTDIMNDKTLTVVLKPVKVEGGVSAAIITETPEAQAARRAASGLKGVRPGSVASIVDPLLFKGENTIPEIAAVLAATETAKNLKNKDVKWYVSDRMWVLKKKGHTVAKDSDGRVRVV